MSKMAAKSKKRLSKIENKLLKLEKLELSDVICSICQSILIEPVTLPCNHVFCQCCFNDSIANNALCCPLCRLRIGSWLRTATKQKNLVNTQLWNFIKNKFPKEIDKKFNGEDVDLPTETPLPRLSAPGEIRSEYEAELKRLRAERLRLEQIQYQETEIFIKKLQQEEQDAHKKYLDSLKQDEILARKLQKDSAKIEKRKNARNSFTKSRLKPATIDSYLAKSISQAPIAKNSPLQSDDNTSTDSSPLVTPSYRNVNRVSPEILPNYGKFMKNFLDKKLKTGTSIWNKENGEKLKEKEVEHQTLDKTDSSEEKPTVKTKNGIQSILVSLPLPRTGIFYHKTSLQDNRNLETGSVDSMWQELCYFKPIEGTTPTSFITSKSLPLKVPGMRVDKEKISLKAEVAPTRDQYIESLRQLRNLSLAQKLPSAFVIALSILRSKKIPRKNTVNTRSRVRKNSPNNMFVPNIFSPKRAAVNRRNKQAELFDGVTKLNNAISLRRTRSMGSISKEENEVTPKKKHKERKWYSDRKPYLRSDSKRMHAKTSSCSPPSLAETTNNKVSLAVKNLSSPLENCDVKNILREQLRIEKLIEQEKNDLEMALKIDAEWNGRRLRRVPAKRQLTLNYALRPTKKLKV